MALIADGYETSALTAREQAVLRYVDTILTDPHALRDAQRDELLAHFGPAELVELTAGVALFLGFSKIAVALGPPPDMPTMVVPTPDWDPSA
ncbi:MAG TPA: hypothetical protein VI462_17930 [Acidimicrobiia bacterium]